MDREQFRLLTTALETIWQLSLETKQELLDISKQLHSIEMRMEIRKNKKLLTKEKK